MIAPRKKYGEIFEIWYEEIFRVISRCLIPGRFVGKSFEKNSCRSLWINFRENLWGNSWRNLWKKIGETHVDIFVEQFLEKLLKKLVGNLLRSPWKDISGRNFDEPLEKFVYKYLKNYLGKLLIYIKTPGRPALWPLLPYDQCISEDIKVFATLSRKNSPAITRTSPK